MTSDLELQARKDNDASSYLRKALAILIKLGYGEEEIMERVANLYDEEMQNT